MWPTTRVSDLPSMSRWFKPSQGAKNLKLRFSLNGKGVCTVQMGKSTSGGDACLLEPGVQSSNCLWPVAPQGSGFLMEAKSFEPTV